MQMRGQDTRGVTGLKHHCTGTIAKQNAGTAIGPVNNAGQGISADNQCPPDSAAANEFIRHTQRIDKAGAHSL